MIDILYELLIFVIRVFCLAYLVFAILILKDKVVVIRNIDDEDEKGHDKHKNTSEVRK